MAKQKYMPEKDTWVRNVAGTNKKVDSYIKSQGGNEWDVAGFKRFMDYHTARQNMDVQANNKSVDTWNTSFAKNQQKQQDLEAQIKKNQQKRKQRQQNLVPQPKKKPQTLKDDLKNLWTLAKDTINPFDNVDAGQALENYAKAGLSDKYKEIQRGSNRFVDSASFGVMSNADKKMTGQTPDYLSHRKVGEGGVTDFITTGLGYLVPGTAEYKALNGMKAGKALTQFGSKGIAQRLVSESVKGSAIGLGNSLAEVGVKEALNPKDQNWKDNAKYVTQSTALGAVADPLLYGVGKGFSKGMESASNSAMKKMLPSQEQVQSALKQTAKTHNAEHALPIRNKNAFDNLLPKTENVNPSYGLNPTRSLIPQIGKPAELPPIDQLTLAEQLQLMNKPTRNVPDFSYGKPVIEPPSNVNVYGVEVPKGNLIDTAPPQYWQKRYEDFAKFVKESGYNENNLSHEAINELWTHFAKPDEPSLNAVIDLAYKGYKESKPLNAADVWDKMGNRPPVSQNAKNILLGNVKPKQTPNVLPELKPQEAVQKSTQTLQPPMNTNIPESIAKPVEAPVNAVEPPVKPLQSVPKQPGERAFYNTVGNSEKLTPEMQQKLNEFDKTYKPMSNEELVNYANKYVSNDMEKAYQFVKNARKFDPRHITVGHRLIDELQKAGDYNKALDVVERLAEQGTKAGQSIQSYSIYNRLTPEGQLLRAQRHVNKINSTIADPAKQVKLSEQNVQDITQTADSIRRFTGQQEQANNVIKIMDNIKKGKLPTDSELETVRSFVSDAKKFVSDLEPGAKPKAPKPIKDVRTRDKVVDFMSKREEVARQRLRSKMNRANSLPVDMFYDLSIIGASKIAKGTVKVADFTEEMVKEFGDMVRPYAQQIYNKAVETFNLQSESMTRQRLSEVEKITNKALKDKNLDVDQADAIREFARQVGTMSGDAKLESSMELQSILQALETPTFGQKLSTAQTIAQLLNPKTIVRNAIGNELFYRVEQLNKLLATPVDMLRSKVTGGERTITFRTHNQGQYWKNWLTGAKAGWNGVNPMGLTTAYDIGPQAFRSKFNPLTYLEKSLGATLRSFDHAGYMRAYNKTLGEMASLRAMNEGLTGTAKKEAIARYIREADANMIQIADQYGKYATFQDNTSLSNALTKVKKAMNFQKGFGMGDLILKYPKTPGNLVMRALEYSPVGVARSMYMLSKIAKVKDPTLTKDATLALTRGIIGTGGFSILGYMLADKGILSSAGNSDYEVASLERNAGKQPNSVNVSALKRLIASGFNLNAAGTQEGDTFVSYDWAQPLSIAVALGTGVDQSVKENGKLSFTGAMQGAFDSASNTIINQSVLKGLNDFMANYPGRTMSDRIGDAVKGTVGSFVPTISNQARQLNDNTTRSTYSPNLLPEIKNRAINRIPSLEKSLPPTYDTLGNKKQSYQNNSNNPFNVLLNPSFVSSYQPSPEAKFLVDFINKTGDKSLAPRMPDKKLDGVPLTSEQYATMQRIMGQETQKGLKNIIPNLRGVNDNEKVRKAIQKVLTDAGKKAREEIRAERGGK